MTVATGEAPGRPSTLTLSKVIASPWFFWGILAIYLVAHVALRLWETPNIAKNDVQEAIAAQSWAWGYHPRNPPLHTWLLMSSYSVFGVSLLAHAVLRYALLGLTYTFAYLCGRRLLSSPALATLSASALTLLTPFAWTVHTALTHTLLLAAINLGTLWAALRFTSTRRAADYALFGLLIGLGFLTKYSYSLFLLPLLAAMLTQAELRRAIFNWRFVITLAVAGLVFAPHAVWMMTARFDFVEFLATKQRSEVVQPYYVEAATGLGNVLVGALSFAAPLLIVFALAFRNARKEQPSQATPWARAVPLTLALSLGLLVLDVFVLRATLFEQRYFMSALIAAPLVLFIWLDHRDRTLKGARWFVIGIVVATVIGFAGLAGRAALSHRSCNRCWEEMPVAELVREVRASGFTSGTIISDHYNLAGNMRIAFPNSRVSAANYYVPHVPFVGRGQCLVVWNARNSGDATPASLTEYLAHEHIPLPAGPPTYFETPIRRSDRMDRFAYWVLPGLDGNCQTR